MVIQKRQSCVIVNFVVFKYLLLHYTYKIRSIKIIILLILIFVLKAMKKISSFWASFSKLLGLLIQTIGLLVVTKMADVKNFINEVNKALDQLIQECPCSFFLWDSFYFLLVNPGNMILNLCQLIRKTINIHQWGRALFKSAYK